MREVGDLLAAGQLLMAEQPAAAMKLLVEERVGRPNVPDSYDMMLSRAAVAAGEPDIAVTHLARVFDEKRPSPALRRVYGEVLLEIGNRAEAGAQLQLAVEAGLPVSSLSLDLKLALQEHLRRMPEATEQLKAVDLHVTSEFGVLDELNRVLYVYCPKVACTVLKATVVMNSQRRDAYVASRLPIHDFAGQDRTEKKVVDALVSPEVFRFAVVREPAARILSAYLNKFVPNPPHEPQGLRRNKQLAIQVGQRLAGVQADPSRGITFKEFVYFLAQADDLDLDPHWMPQSRILGNDLARYDHVGRFEALATTFTLLEQQFGYKIERDSSAHLGGQRDHVTKYSAERGMRHPSLALPADLRRLGLVYPVADAFLTPDLRKILLTRFAEDAAVHASA